MAERLEATDSQKLTTEIEKLSEDLKRRRTSLSGYTYGTYLEAEIFLTGVRFGLAVDQGRETVIKFKDIVDTTVPDLLK